MSFGFISGSFYLNRKSSRELGLDLSHGLNSLKRGYAGDYIGEYYRVIKGGYQEFRLCVLT